MLIYIQFLVAFAMLVMLTRWLTRKTDPSFGTGRIMLALAAKVLMGCLYGYVFLKYYNGDDTWVFNADSMNEMRKLLDRPVHFFEDINLFRQIREYGLVQGLKEFRSKLELAMIIKPLAIFNLYSKGNYYINIIAFSSITFWGHFWLYQLIRQKWPESRNWVFLVVFLYPPVLFWLSGIRTDGILFFFFSLLLYQFNNWLSTGKRSGLYLAVFAITGMLFIRSSTGMLLLPGLVAWWLVSRKKLPIRKTFITVHALGLLFFFATGLLDGYFNLPGMVVNKQQEFLALTGKTRLTLEPLHANPVSFIKAFPQAVANTTLFPNPWEAKGGLQYITVIQNYFLICLFVVVMIRRFPGRRFLAGEPVFTVLLFFSVCVYLSIGYTIPFPGAIVRYKVIPEISLLLLLLFAAGGKELSNYKYFNVYKNRRK